eukprot:4898972-Amphidinium_carterae.1
MQAARCWILDSAPISSGPPFCARTFPQLRTSGGTFDCNAAGVPQAGVFLDCSECCEGYFKNVGAICAGEWRSHCEW